MGEEMLFQESTTERDSKSSWLKHEAILSLNRCFSEGWWGQGCVTALQWVPVYRTESGAPSEHRENCGLLGRPVLIPQAAGTCLGGLISRGGGSALFQLGTGQVCLFTVVLGFVSLELCDSQQHPLTHFAVPCVRVWGLGLVGRSSWELNSAGQGPW